MVLHNLVFLVPVNAESPYLLMKGIKTEITRMYNIYTELLRDKGYTEQPKPDVQQPVEPMYLQLGGEVKRYIKNRINRIFTSNKFIPKSIQNNIKNVEVEPTGSFYIALIKKFSEINHIKPAFNKVDYVDYDKSINDFKSPSKEFLVIDKGRNPEEKSFLLVSNKKIIGYGYFELNNQVNTEKKLFSRTIKINNNQNIENILNYIITKQKFKKLIPLNKIYTTSQIE